MSLKRRGLSLYRSERCNSAAEMVYPTSMIVCFSRPGQANWQIRYPLKRVRVAEAIRRSQTPQYPK